MMTHTLLIKWLSDAYEMEQALAPVLERHAREARDYPEMKAKLEAHCAQSQQQNEQLRACIERLGGRVKPVKSAVGGMFSMLSSFMSGAARADVLKNCALDLAAEYMEVATYSAIIEAAKAVDDTETVQLCSTICADERAMAKWLEVQAPVMAQEHLRRQMRAEGEQPVAREPMRGYHQPSFAESLETKSVLDDGEPTEL